MAIPPVLVKTARCGWAWQWQRLMGGLGPAGPVITGDQPVITRQQRSRPGLWRAARPLNALC